MRVEDRSIRQERQQKSTRVRDCWHCMNKINKGEQYMLREFRYDKTIISAYFHLECYNQHTMNI